jgi:hypothetical protein
MDSPSSEAARETIALRAARLQRLRDASLVPFVWFKRTRGRKRQSLIFIAALIGTIVVAFLWRAVSLVGLPDLGEPFDMALFSSYEVPQSEDAFVVYRQAFAQNPSPVGDTSYGNTWGNVRVGWSRATPALKARIDEHRPALLLWREGAARARAMPMPPGHWKPTNALQECFERMLDFGSMALVEGSRLEEQGDLAGAWAWYNAVLRAGSHMQMHSPSYFAGIGSILVSLAAERVARWPTQPGLDAITLRRALDDLKAVDAMTPPNSDALKADYFALSRMFDNKRFAVDPNDATAGPFNIESRLHRLSIYLKREPERSKRVARIICAHWLRYADAPPSARPRLSELQVVGIESYPDFPYSVPPDSNPADYPISAHRLYLWHRSTLYASEHVFWFMYHLQARDNQRRVQGQLLTAVAKQLYLRENGKLPANAEELVHAGYLQELSND